MWLHDYRMSNIARFVLLGCLIGLIGFGVIFPMGQENTKTKVMQSRDTRLDSMTGAQGLAEGFLRVLLIHDNESYQRIKEQLQFNLSYELQKELFGTETFDGADRMPLTYKVLSNFVEESGAGEYTCRVEYEVYAYGSSSTRVSLITVRDGKIIEVSTL